MKPAHRLAIVLRSGEDSCLVVGEGEPFEVPFAPFFPRPRVERVLPGHLVAVLDDLVVWRWFDGVVVEASADVVRVSEPAHGEVDARKRRTDQHCAPGQRAYLSAGLPDAEWWLEGQATGKANEALVDVEAVHAFLKGHGLLTAGGD